MLNHWISRWWGIANDRRRRLIFQREEQGGLSEEETRELVMLQAVEGIVMGFESSPVCVHEWIDARNKIVESGELCLKCFAIRAGNATTDGKIA